MRIARCNSCGAEIIWVTTPNGKNMPVNLAEDPRGSIYLDADGRMGQASLTGAPPEGTLTRHLSHFATCPQAQKWRRS